MKTATVGIESLEPRRLLASAWQQPEIPCDVDGSGVVSPVDALLVIERLDRDGAGVLPERPADSSEPYYDTSGDGVISAIDLLLVIDLLKRGAPPPRRVAGIAPESDPNGNGVVLTDSVGIRGQTHPGGLVVLRTMGDGWGESLSVRADEAGRFSVDVPLEGGKNEIEISVRNELGERVKRTLSVVRGDMVQDWNAAALNVVREWSTTSDDPYEGRIVPSEPPRVARNLAMIHGAIFDALNAFDGGYQSYLVTASPHSNAVPEVAAATAAYRVASALYSADDELAVWDATLYESIRQFFGRDLTESQDFGRLVADAFLAARANDGADVAGSYEPGNNPGDWNRTPPEYIPPLLPAWDDVVPFGLRSADQFRPPPPPALDSAEYAEAVDEVMRLGAYDSELRTADQTEIAVFWADSGGTFTPPGHWNQIASDAISTRQLDLIDSARTFALLNYALADAGIAAWDAKYGYDLWRPIDAIRRADTDGNDATEPNADWMPLIATPPFPTYTSGHSTFSGAAAEVLTVLFGEEFAFSSEIDRQSSAGQRPLPADRIVTRYFTSFWEAAEEAGISRIYGGIHFSFDNTAGLESGRSVGEWIVTHLLQPKR